MTADPFVAPVAAGDAMSRPFVLCPACFQAMPRRRPRCDLCGSRGPDPAVDPAHATQAEAMRAAREAVREPARLAAAVIRAGQADRAALGECRATHMDARPEWFHRFEWAHAPGFVKTVAGSRRARTKPPVTTFSHRLLPGWVYEEHELWELLQDLDDLAAGKGWPTAATANKPGVERRQGRLL